LTPKNPRQTAKKTSSATNPSARKPAEKAAAKTSRRAAAKSAQPRRRARVIAVANQKGGVGKSTTAVSLGAALAELGHRVLIVDLDPQGNASTGLGIRHEARDVTIYDVLAAEAPIEAAIVQTLLPYLFAIPSTIDLAGAEIELVSQFSRELRLRKALEPLKAEAFEFIFLDCPPSLGLLTVNALAAAEELIVPIQCEYYALEGLGQLLRNVKLVQQNVNIGLRLTGIVMTMFDPRTKLSQQVVDEVRRYFGDRVYRTIIPRTVRLSEAPGFGQPITVYDPGSKGAQCYRDLAKEVAVRLPDESPLPTMDDLPAVTVRAPEPQPAKAPRPLVREEAEVEAAVDEPGAEPREEPLAEVETPKGAEASISSPEPEPIVALSVEPESMPGEPKSAPEASASNGDAGPVEDWVRELETEAAMEAETPPAATEGPSHEGRPAGSVPEGEPEPRRVVVIEGATKPEQAPSQDEPEPQPDRKGFRGLFRRGGDR
jgi:chromosome partitioning protein